jgi:hypothetical protein
MTAERISLDDLGVAADWLESYDGDGDEAEQRCHRVAEWLRRQIEQRETEAVARRNGVSRKIARKAIQLAKENTSAEKVS